MQATKLRPGTRRGGVIWLPVDELEPSPMQPRKNFPDGELQELSESIAQYGVLNPLTVRLRDGRYELVAGERGAPCGPVRRAVHTARREP